MFIDECKAKKYLLYVVEIEGNAFAAARLSAKSVRKKRHNKILFVFESETRKRHILKAFSTLPIRVRSYEVAGESELAARTTCLAAMIRDLELSESYSIVFNRGINHEVNDRRIIRRELVALNMIRQVSYRHEEPVILAWDSSTCPTSRLSQGRQSPGRD